MPAIDPQFMREISLKEFPISLVELDSWPWWRRFLNRPPELVLMRCAAWRSLLKLREMTGNSARLNTPKSKIFDDSRRRWDFLDNINGSNFTLLRNFPVRTTGSESDFQSPHGTLVQVTIVPHFKCDAKDIEGICSSKSAELQYESVDELGACYIDEQNRFARKGKAPLRLDEASLKELCTHKGIELLHGRNSETFSVRAWDGRLFIDNYDGSHHLAGAVHIAKRIGQRIPLTSNLSLYRLNNLTVQWLLNSFHLILLPTDMALKVLGIVKILVGSGSSMALPSVLAVGTLLAFPRDSQMADCVMTELLSHGHHDLGVDLKEALIAQQRFLSNSTSPLAKQLSSQAVVVNQFWPLRRAVWPQWFGHPLCGADRL